MSERCGDDLKDQFDRHAHGGPQPHHRVGHGGEHRERHRPARILPLPCPHRHKHQDAPDPRGGHDQHQADVKPRARDQRRVKSEEDRRLAHRYGNDRDNDAKQRDPVCGPGPHLAGKWPVQRGDRNEIAKAHDEERRKHIGHRHAMRRHRHEILPGRADIRAQGAAHPHLPGADQASEQERAERHPKMRETQPLNVAHRKSSRQVPA